MSERQANAKRLPICFVVAYRCYANARLNDVNIFLIWIRWVVNGIAIIININSASVLAGGVKSISNKSISCCQPSPPPSSPLFLLLLLRCIKTFYCFSLLKLLVPLCFAMLLFSFEVSSVCCHLKYEWKNEAREKNVWRNRETTRKEMRKNSRIRCAIRCRETIHLWSWSIGKSSSVVIAVDVVVAVFGVAIELVISSAFH